eukprot:gb/GECH01013601.1/.p1 GENE.gb/GECH01013601.1/~~gb/GECH01013601.1/.p1  ORF type:complete len:1603 (+),score=414.79 gb/GECH01013601.1/:1-4809(+)
MLSVDELFHMSTNDTASYLYSKPEMIECFLKTNIEQTSPSEVMTWVLPIIGGGRNTSETLTMLTTSNEGVCGKTWKPGEIAYKCNTCQADPTCAICAECFRNSNHEGHDWSLVRNSSGMCDCGDPESWSVEGFCKNHQGPSDANPLDQLDSNQKSVIVHTMNSVIGALDSLIDDPESKSEISTFLNKLEPLLQYSAILRRATMDALLKPNRDQCYLKKFFQKNQQIAPAISNDLVDHFYSALLIDQSFKWVFGEYYVENAVTMFNDPKLKHRNMNHLAVQMFTVPSIAKNLIQKYHVYEQLLKALESAISNNLSEPPTIDISSDCRHRLVMILTDLRYLFLCDNGNLVDYFCESKSLLERWLTMLYHFHGCVTVEREDSDESNWENGFITHLAIRDIQEAIFVVFQKWIKSNDSPKIEQVISFMHSTFEFLKSIYEEYKPLTREVETNNPNIPFVKSFNVRNDSFTFLIPIHRLLSIILQGLVENPSLSLDSIFKDLGINSNHEYFPIMDFLLRLQAARAHVRSGMWRRNNVHIVEQALSYESSQFISSMLFPDFFLLQTCAASIDPDYFLLTALYMFQGEAKEIFALYRNEEEEEKHIESLTKDLNSEEHFLEFIMNIIGDRSLAGLTSEELVRKYIIHVLFTGKQTFSAIERCIPSFAKKKVNIDAIVQDVAEYSRPPGSVEQGHFIIKDKCWREVDPLLLNLTKKEIHTIEENYVQYRKKKGIPQPEDILPVSYSEPRISHLSSLKHILHSSVLLQIIFVILHNAAAKSQRCSEYKLTMALQLLILALETYRTPAKQENVEAQKPNKKKFTNMNDLQFPSLNDLISNVTHAFMIDSKQESVLSLLIKLKAESAYKDQRKAIQRILDRIADLDAQCDDLISELDTEDSEEEERRKKQLKERAKQRQQEMMRRFRERQDSILASKSISTEEENPLSSSTTCSDENPDSSFTDAVCAFCHSKQSPSEGSSELSMITHVTQSGINQLNLKQNFFESVESLKGDIHVPQSYVDSIVLDENEVPSSMMNLQANFCGHYLHSECFSKLLGSVIHKMLDREYFNGFQLINFEKTEFLCPVCSRISNAICPVRRDYFDALSDTLENKLHMETPLTPEQNIFESFKNTIKSEYMKLKDNPDDESINLSSEDQKRFEDFAEKAGFIENEEYLGDHSAAYDNCIQIIINKVVDTEIQQRLDSSTVVNLEELQKKEIRSLFRSACFLNKLYQSVHVQKLSEFLTISGFDSSQDEVTQDNILVRHLFGEFISLLVNLPSLISSPELFSSTLQYFFVLNIIQSLLLRHIWFDKQLSMVDTPLNNFVRDFVSKENEKTQDEIDESMDKLPDEDFIKMMVLPFLRQSALFKNALTNSSLPNIHNNQSNDKNNNDNDEFSLWINETDDLCQYLSLPSVHDIFRSSKQSNVLQFAHSNLNHMKSELIGDENLASIAEELKEALPKYGLPRPFHLIDLPQDYQTIIHKYFHSKCDSCGFTFKHSSVCLITGKLTGLGRCQCDTLNGNSFAWSQRLPGGVGIFLIPSMCHLLNIRQGRHAFLPPPYLDAHGEEDSGLIRGSPLYRDDRRLKEVLRVLVKNSWDSDTRILNLSNTRRTDKI